MTSHSSTLLCIDYGISWSGIAISHYGLAEPLQTIPTDQIFKHINNLLEEHAISAIILGMSEGKMANETKAFGEKLSIETSLPVYFHDETLSSQETRTALARAGIKKSKRETKIDHYVAAMILQDYIDSQSE